MLSLWLSLAMAGSAPGDGVDPCYHFVNDSSGGGYEYVGDRKCYDFADQRTFKGLLIWEFEGVRYVDGQQTFRDCIPYWPPDRVWLTLDEQTKNSVGFKPIEGHAYEIEFVGRPVRDMHRDPDHGYGHFGMSSGLVVVDEMLSFKDLGRFRDPRVRLGHHLYRLPTQICPVRR